MKTKKTCCWRSSPCNLPVEGNARFCKKHLQILASIQVRKKYGPPQNNPSAFGSGYSKYD